MQRYLPPNKPFRIEMPYSSMCLLIAVMHVQVSGHDAFSFEMVHEKFRDQVRASTSAPVEVDGGGIGMVNCPREVLRSVSLKHISYHGLINEETMKLQAFEQLVACKVFTTIVAPSSTTAPQFVRYRCHAAREDVKRAIDISGQLNLKKWLSKAQ